MSGLSDIIVVKLQMPGIEKTTPRQLVFGLTDLATVHLARRPHRGHRRG
jgi:hypothetical protein